MVDSRLPYQGQAPKGLDSDKEVNDQQTTKSLRTWTDSCPSATESEYLLLKTKRGGITNQPGLESNSSSDVNVVASRFVIAEGLTFLSEELRF